MENQKKNNLSILVPFIFSSQAITGKLLIMLAPILIYIQGTLNIEFWEKIANISIAIFVLLVGIYILWKEYRRQDVYTKEQNERIVEMAKRTAQLAESSTRAAENSTEAIRNMTNSLERIFNRLDKIEN